MATIAASFSAVILPKYTESHTSLKSAFTLAPRHGFLCKNINSHLRLSTTPGTNGVRSRPVCRAANTAVEIETQSGMAKPAAVLPFRVGHGFDLHRLEPGLPLIIGGISIPHDRGCDAHSDGDVLLHCVVDAILGALGLPDIGQLFPDNDPKWRGADSSVFLKEAVRLMHEAGYELGNLDATLILQRPKLSPHKEVIRSNLCKLLGADSTVVNIKAKTHEKVDSLGENRSIAAHTVVLLMKK
uniref:2-C-methyl-D-erythritol 2,4-cyclodiphosphate synthase n=1 Tax=Araucaria cunninghamii TaxID=56994 RepID=A0A0D6R0U0_ARACU